MQACSSSPQVETGSSNEVEFGAAILPGERDILLRSLTRFTQNVDTAEDCLQSAFVRLEEYRRHTPIENAMGFVARAARNIAIDEARKAIVRARSAGSVQDLMENCSADQLLQDEALMVRERLDRARAILTELPERTRTAFLMHRFTRAKYREIAVELGISVSAVEKHIARASQALATSLEQEDHEMEN
jgi:RNA polymerase sigma-70 factor (ECF subfamily)